MALSWNTLRHFPRLLSYEDAAKREAETKPIRGREPEVKPLGKRGQRWHKIRREENGDIVIASWPGDIIRYRDNGDVVIYDASSWQKATTNEIIQEVTGLEVWTEYSKAWVTCGGETNYLRPSPARIYVPAKGWVDNPEPRAENIFRRSAGPNGYVQWVYMNPPAHVVHHIRRKELTRVMKSYASFVAYATSMDSLRNNTPTKAEEYAELFGVEPSSIYNGQKWYHWYSTGMPPRVGYRDFDHAQAEKLCSLMLSDDATDNLKAFMWLKMDTNRPPAEVARAAVIMHHHAEVLKRVEKSGSARDRYKWAIPTEPVNLT